MPNTGMKKAASTEEKWVLQLCHGYDMPFHDVARQYATLFKNTDYKVATVFLTGKSDQKIVSLVASDEVIFLENTSKDIRGLKRKQINQVRKLCEKRNYIFCIAHRFKPIYIATHVKDLFVIGVHHAFGGYNRWTRRLYANKKKNNLALLGVSNAIRDDIRKALPTYPKQQICTLYNRIDIGKQKSQLLDQRSARAVLGLPQSAYIFGNVGRLHPDKDQSTLLKSFALVYQTNPDAYLVIMGKGRLRNELEEEALYLGISKRVIFTGAVPNGSQYFEAFDSFLLSSDHEPFGMVLLEAMIAGLPIAYSNTGGAPEVVGDTGFSFPLGDSSALAKLMERLITLNDKDRRKIVERMEARVHALFIDKAVCESFWKLSFLDKVLSKKNITGSSKRIEVAP